jgi:adenine-specific DNA-methyltransferase
LRGRDIKRYNAELVDLWLIATFPALKLNIDNYPAVKTYLQTFGKRLHQTGEEFIDENGQKSKSRKKTSNKWFETQDQIGYYQEFGKEKIVWKRIGSIIRFQYDKEGSLCLDSTCFLTGGAIKFLTAYLNSKVAINQLLENSPKTGTGDVIISVQALEPILVPQLSKLEQKPFVDLVEQILKNKSEGKPTTALEAAIDVLVYRLYALRYAEVKAIDPTFSMSESAYEALPIG